jgi:hypothetical protein
VRRHVDVPPPVPGAPGIFAFADPDRLRGALEEAGFSDVTVEELPVTVMEVPSGEVFWDITQDLAGPIMALMRDLPPDRRAAIGAEVAQAAEAYREGDVVRVGGVAWIASGRKR